MGIKKFGEQLLSSIFGSSPSSNGSNKIDMDLVRGSDSDNTQAAATEDRETNTSPNESSQAATGPSENLQVNHSARHVTESNMRSADENTNLSSMQSIFQAAQSTLSSQEQKAREFGIKKHLKYLPAEKKQYDNLIDFWENDYINGSKILSNKECLEKNPTFSKSPCWLRIHTDRHDKKCIEFNKTVNQAEYKDCNDLFDYICMNNKGIRDIQMGHNKSDLKEAIQLDNRVSSAVLFVNLNISPMEFLDKYIKKPKTIADHVQSIEVNNRKLDKPEPTSQHRI